MTSTTPSYLKRTGQGRSARRVYAQWRAERSTAVFCSCACIRAGSSLFSLPPVLRKSKSVQSSFIPPSLYPARFLRVPLFFFSLSLSLSPRIFRLFSTLVRSRSSYALLSLRPICFACSTFSTRAHAGLS